VTGDTVSGSHRPLRAVLSARQQADALAVPRREPVQVQAERYCQLKALTSLFFRKSGEERHFFGLFS
jgi:hypothetical protein